MEARQKVENEKNFRKRIRMFCERTTIHAVPNIVTNDYMPLKIMWTICLVASVGYCIQILTSSIIDYYQYKVVTKYEIVKESSSYFPRVVICNLDPFDMTKNVNSNETQGTFEISDFEKEQFKDDPKEMLAYTKEKFMKLSDDYLFSKRITLDDMLVSCHFNEASCDASNFELIENDEYGNCYAFNTKIKNDARNRTDRSINMNGAKLQIELFIGTAESSSPASTRSGAIVFVKNETTIDKKSEPGIELAPGTLTNIALNRMIISKLPSPHNDCVDQFDEQDFQSDLHKFVFTKMGYYDRHKCNQLFFSRLLLEICNCYDKDLSNLTLFDVSDRIMYEPSVSLCSTSNDTQKKRFENNCKSELKRKFFENVYQESCNSFCPAECESITYKPSLSVSLYPSSIYETILRNNQNIKKLASRRKADPQTLDMKSSFLAFSVYFESDMYTKITEVRKTSFSNLLANMGGQFGLFLGISLLSFLELIELFIWLIVYVYREFVEPCKNKVKRFISNQA